MANNPLTRFDPSGNDWVTTNTNQKSYLDNLSQNGTAGQQKWANDQLNNNRSSYQTYDSTPQGPIKISGFRYDDPYELKKSEEIVTGMYGGFVRKVEGAIIESIEKNILKVETKIYAPTAKHETGGAGTLNPIPDLGTGQKLLDTAYSSSKNKQLYNIYDEKIVKFQPDNTGGWHAYEVILKKDIPTDVLRRLREDDKISYADYKRYINNTKSK